MHQALSDPAQYFAESFQPRHEGNRYVFLPFLPYQRLYTNKDPRQLLCISCRYIQKLLIHFWNTMILYFHCIFTGYPSSTRLNNHKTLAVSPLLHPKQSPPTNMNTDFFDIIF